MSLYFVRHFAFQLLYDCIDDAEEERVDREQPGLVERSQALQSFEDMKLFAKSFERKTVFSLGELAFRAWYQREEEYTRDWLESIASGGTRPYSNYSGRLCQMLLCFCFC